MGLSVFEDYLEAVKAYMIANLPTHMTAINTEKGDTELKTMKETIIGYTGSYQLNHYPVMFLYPSVFNFDDLSMGSTDNTTTLNIMITDSAGKKTATRMLRYAAALWNLLKSDWTLGNSVCLSKLIRGVNYPPDSDNTGIIVFELDLVNNLTY